MYVLLESNNYCIRQTTVYFVIQTMLDYNIHIHQNTIVGKQVSKVILHLQCLYPRSRGIPFHSMHRCLQYKKGASTYCTSGTTAGPSVVVVCQRAGWSMGPTLERYLKMDKHVTSFADELCAVFLNLPGSSQHFHHILRTSVPVQNGMKSSLL